MIIYSHGSSKIYNFVNMYLQGVSGFALTKFLTISLCKYLLAVR
jgi:hypothetical protein